MPKISFLCALEVGFFCDCDFCSGGKTKSTQPSSGWIWIGLDRIQLEFDNISSVMVSPSYVSLISCDYCLAVLNILQLYVVVLQEAIKISWGEILNVNAWHFFQGRGYLPRHLKTTFAYTKKNPPFLAPWSFETWVSQNETFI